MVDSKYRNQFFKAREILEKRDNTEIKSKIYYFSQIFKIVNMLNFELPGKKIRLDY